MRCPTNPWATDKWPCGKCDSHLNFMPSGRQEAMHVAVSVPLSVVPSDSGIVNSSDFGGSTGKASAIDGNCSSDMITLSPLNENPLES